MDCSFPVDRFLQSSLRRALTTVRSDLVTWGTHVIPGSASWRVPVGFQIALGVFLCVAILYIPESPRHLLNHDKVDEARAAVASLNSTTPDSELTSAIMKELTEGIAMENDVSLSSTPLGPSALGTILISLI